MTQHESGLSQMDIRRHLMGIIGLAFMGAWAAVVLSPSPSDTLAFAAGSSLRIGLVLGALWLSFPQLKQLGGRFPPWFFALVGFLVLVVAVRPRMIVYVLPVAGAIVVLQFVGWLFKPLPQKQSKRTTQKQREP